MIRFTDNPLDLPIGGPNEPGRRLYDPITAITGAVSAGTSLIGGIFKSKTANSAAQLQADAAKQAAAGVTDATNNVNPNIISTAQKAGQDSVDTAGDQAVYQNKIAQNSANQATDVAGNAAADANASAVTANAGLDPYTNAGGVAASAEASGVAPGGDFNKTPTLADLQIDPGYAFREQQGEDALTRSAAANGGVGGGGFAKDLQNYVQGSASQEYQNAFNRFETSTQNRFANVNAVANAGQAASTTKGTNLINASEYGGNLKEGAAQFGGTTLTNAAQLGAGLNTNASEYAGTNNINATDLTSSNTINAAKTAGDYLTQGANAQAAGKVAASNAIWGGITGAANTALGTVLATRPSQNYIQKPQFGDLSTED